MGDFGLFVRLEDEPVWQVVIAETDEPVMIEVIDDRQIVVLSADLGSATISNTAGLDALALEYSALHTTTGGARIAKLKSEGTYLLQADFGLGRAVAVRIFSTSCGAFRTSQPAGATLSPKVRTLKMTLSN